MPDYVDLEVELSRIAANTYRLACRLDDPTNNQIPTPDIAEFSIDVPALERLRKAGDIGQYRSQLANSVFGGAGGVLRAAYDEAVDIARRTSSKVRFRLLIDDTALDLHSQWWEAIPDPADNDGHALSTADYVYFSRVLQHGRSRQLTLRNRNAIRALAVVANPAPEPGKVWAEEIDTDAEKQRVQQALGGISLNFLCSSTTAPGNASMARIIRELGSSYDILYLVCHGSFDYDRQPPDSLLRLEREDGQADFVSGRTFVAEIERLPNPPSIIVLCSCETNGAWNNKSSGILAALGPQLVQAGVPAVIAMNGEIRRSTAATFFSRMLAELSAEGVIDRAVGVARREVEQTALGTPGNSSPAPDYFVPVLYHRLRSGRIWYGNNEPTSKNPDINWDAQLRSLARGKTTVIMGSALLDQYLGSQAEMALQLADRFHYAFADSERDDLALVSQFGDCVLARDNLAEAVTRESLRQLIREYRMSLGLTEADVNTLLNDPEPHLRLKKLLRDIWRQQNPNDDPFRILASLPFKAYISTNFDDLIEAAIAEENQAKPDSKSPTVLQCGLADPRKIISVRFSAEEQPTPAKPLIAYLYGGLDDPEKMVLTEKDYYRQLTDAARGDTALVKSLNSVFTNSALVFLGFRLHEWDFRVLYRRLQLIEGWESHLRFFHVAVQIDPSSARGTGSDSEVRKFLTQFFDSPKIQIFHGSVLQFVREFRDKFQNSPFRAAAVHGGNNV